MKYTNQLHYLLQLCFNSFHQICPWTHSLFWFLPCGRKHLSTMQNSWGRGSTQNQIWLHLLCLTCFQLWCMTSSVTCRLMFYTNNSWGRRHRVLQSVSVHVGLFDTDRCSDHLLCSYLILCSTLSHTSRKGFSPRLCRHSPEHSVKLKCKTIEAQYKVWIRKRNEKSHSRYKINQISAQFL